MVVCCWKFEERKEDEKGVARVVGRKEGREERCVMEKEEIRGVWWINRKRKSISIWR